MHPKHLPKSRLVYLGHLIPFMEHAKEQRIIYRALIYPPLDNDMLVIDTALEAEINAINLLIEFFKRRSELPITDSYNEKITIRALENTPWVLALLQILDTSFFKVYPNLSFLIEKTPALLKFYQTKHAAQEKHNDYHEGVFASYIFAGALYQCIETGIATNIINHPDFPFASIINRKLLISDEKNIIDEYCALDKTIKNAIWARSATIADFKTALATQIVLNWKFLFPHEERPKFDAKPFELAQFQNRRLVDVLYEPIQDPADENLNLLIIILKSRLCRELIYRCPELILDFNRLIENNPDYNGVSPLFLILETEDGRAHFENFIDYISAKTLNHIITGKKYEGCSVLYLLAKHALLGHPKIMRMIKQTALLNSYDGTTPLSLMTVNQATVCQANERYLFPTFYSSSLESPYISHVGDLIPMVEAALNERKDKLDIAATMQDYISAKKYRELFAIYKNQARRLETFLQFCRSNASQSLRNNNTWFDSLIAIVGPIFFTQIYPSLGDFIPRHHPSFTAAKYLTALKDHNQQLSTLADTIIIEVLPAVLTEFSMQYVLDRKQVPVFTDGDVIIATKTKTIAHFQTYIPSIRLMHQRINRAKTLTVADLEQSYIEVKNAWEAKHPNSRIDFSEELNFFEQSRKKKFKNINAFLSGPSPYPDLNCFMYFMLNQIALTALLRHPEILSPALLNHQVKTGPHRGTTGFLLLIVSAAGPEFIRNHPNILQIIDAKTLNSMILNDETTKASVLFYLVVEDLIPLCPGLIKFFEREAFTTPNLYKGRIISAAEWIEENNPALLEEHKRLKKLAAPSPSMPRRIPANEQRLISALTEFQKIFSSRNENLFFVVYGADIKTMTIQFYGIKYLISYLKRLITESHPKFNEQIILSDIVDFDDNVSFVFTAETQQAIEFFEDKIFLQTVYTMITLQTTIGKRSLTMIPRLSNSGGFSS